MVTPCRDADTGWNPELLCVIPLIANPPIADIDGGGGGIPQLNGVLKGWIGVGEDLVDDNISDRLEVAGRRRGLAGGKLDDIGSAIRQPTIGNAHVRGVSRPIVGDGVVAWESNLIDPIVGDAR